MLSIRQRKKEKERESRYVWLALSCGCGRVINRMDNAWTTHDLPVGSIVIGQGGQYSDDNDLTLGSCSKGLGRNKLGWLCGVDF